MKFKKRFLMLMTLVLMSLSLASCFNGEGSLFDNLGGGGVGEIQENADTSAIDELEDRGSDIVGEIENIQVNVDPNEETVVAEAIKISEAGDYVLSGTIEGQINVKAQGVRLFLSNTTIRNIGKKVINSDEDIVIGIVDGTTIHEVEHQAVVVLDLQSPHKSPLTINGK